MVKKFLSLFLTGISLININNIDSINNVNQISGNEIIQNIEGGDSLEGNEYNWFAYLISEQENHTNHSNHTILGCGSLVNSEWVLTSGHIARFYEDTSENNKKLLAHFKLRFGDSRNIQQNLEVEIDRIVYHPSFNVDTFTQRKDAVDLALLHLKSPIYNINPIDMYFNSQSRFPLSEVTVLGQGSGNQSNSRKKLEIFYIDKITAKQVYGNILLHQPIYSEQNDFFLSMITNNSKKIQEGDSGGPVVKKINDKPYLIGLIKGSPKSIKDPAPVYVGVGIRKQFKWFSETTNIDF